jgi:hypothetical protein
MEKDMKEICLFGTKQSGKTTTATAIYAYIAVQKEAIPMAKFEEDGSVIVEYPDGKGFRLDIDTQDENIRTFYAERIYKHVMHASYADKLKHVTSLLFDVPLEDLYGSNEDKEKESSVLWENMSLLVDVSYYKNTEGFMTIRELLEVFGTDVLRTIEPDVHIKGAFKTLEKWNPAVAILPDGRFENEFLFCEKRKEENPKDVCLIKHTRKPFESFAKSENGLNDIDDDRFDLVVPESLTLKEKNELVINYLITNKYLDGAKVKIDASPVS